METTFNRYDVHDLSMPGDKAMPTGFIIDFDMATKLVKELDPSKLRETTKSYTLRLSCNHTFLEARNADDIVEYNIELMTDPVNPPAPPDYKEALEDLIAERKMYKKILRDTLVITLFIAMGMLGVIIYGLSIVH